MGPYDHLQRELSQAFTFVVGTETFGIEVARVQTIFRVEAVTRVPLARPEVVGLVNLRGAIVPAICLKRRLGLGQPATAKGALAIGIEDGAACVALLVDAVGDVVALLPENEVAPPPHLSPARVALTRTLYRHEGGILPILDLHAVVTLPTAPPLAA